MAYREYVGSRYVPIFGRKGETSIEWDNTAPYEPLTVVLHQGNSYTSRQFVPVGIDIANEEYWAETGNYNAQIEQYQANVRTFDARITANANAIDKINNEIDEISEEVAEQHLGILSKCGRDFQIVDRWLIDRDGTEGNGYYTDQVSSVQNGLCFIQNNTRYYAQFILTSESGLNSLHIRNIDAHVNVAVLNDVTSYHDPSMTYIDGFIYLVDDTAKTLIKIDVTNPANPSMTSVQLQHTTHYDLIAFISATEYVGLSANGTTLDYYNVGDATMIRQLALSTPAIMTTSVIQSIYANDKYCVFAHWQPNAVSVFDITTGKHIKTIGMETWYDFVPCQEVESATIAGNGLYVNLAQTLEGYNLPCVLYVPIDNAQTFKPSTCPFVFESNDTGLYRRQAYVNNVTGKLFMDKNHYPNRFEFKFATDAANALRSIGSGGTINFGGASYPRFVAIFDGVWRIAHYGSSVTALAGLRFVNCVFSITDLTSFIFYANNRYNDSEYNAIYCLACIVHADSTDVADWRGITVNAGVAPTSAKKRLMHLRQCISALQTPKNCRVEYGMVGLRYNADTDTNCVLNYSCVVVSSEPGTFERD